MQVHLYWDVSGYSHQSGGTLAGVAGLERASLHGVLPNKFLQVILSWWACGQVGADVAGLAAVLKKPLRPLWVSQRSHIWLNEVAHPADLPFTPLILISASLPDARQRRIASESPAGTCRLSETCLVYLMRKLQPAKGARRTEQKIFISSTSGVMCGACDAQLVVPRPCSVLQGCKQVALILRRCSTAILSCNRELHTWQEPA